MEGNIPNALRMVILYRGAQLRKTTKANGEIAKVNPRRRRIYFFSFLFVLKDDPPFTFLPVYLNFSHISQKMILKYRAVVTLLILNF